MIETRPDDPAGKNLFSLVLISLMKGVVYAEAESLLLVLLRKKLAELDAQGGEARLILNREQIVDLLRVFMPAVASEVRLFDRLDMCGWNNSAAQALSLLDTPTPDPL